MAANYYLTNTQRRGFLGHLSIGVQSYEKSKTYYTALLEPFGLSLVYDNPDRRILGYGIDSAHEILNIFERGEEARPPGAGFHVAFNAPNRNCVREFWKAGVLNGGRCDGPPGVRHTYGANYYAAFVFDPDGYKLEAVFQEAEVEGEGSE